MYHYESIVYGHYLCIMYFHYFDQSYCLETGSSTFFATASIMAVKVACRNSSDSGDDFHQKEQATNKVNKLKSWVL